MSATLPSPAPSLRRARGVASGTCGELAQGQLPGGRPFVVTCPIDRGTSVDVTLEPAAQLTIHGVPAGARFLERALRRTAELVELAPCRITVEHRSALPVGKGMASSTADIVAAATALSTAAGAPLPAADLGALAAAIEPTDGIMYDGIVASDPRTGEQLRNWAWWPQFVVVMAVPAATFRTPLTRFAGQERLSAEYADLLARLDAAVVARDSQAFAAQATRSAALNEAFLPSPVRAQLEPHTARLGAVGLCVAHTGTVAGLLFPSSHEGIAAADRAARDLEARLGSALQISTARTRPWPATARL